MADFAAIFSVIARSSSLALTLYKVATASPQPADITRIARSISTFSTALKQVGTLIREDDTIYSSEAGETLEDVLGQVQSVLDEIETIVLGKEAYEDEDEAKVEGHLTDTQSQRLPYLHAHIDALRATLTVFQQTLYTAQSIIWASIRPSISPQQAAAAVGNEKTQLENAVIEQQISLLSASKVHQSSRPDARLLMESESANSLMLRNSGLPNPATLHRYQERFIASLDISETSEDGWLPAVCGIAKSHLERLLERWTRLPQFHERMDYERRRDELQKRETQQPTVESDSEEDFNNLRSPRRSRDFTPTSLPHRPGSVQPLFSDSPNLPIPVKDPRYGPTAPISPAPSSPRSSSNSLAPGSMPMPIPAPSSPRTSTTALEPAPHEEEPNLEIPWKLCTRRHYWRYVDGTITDRNTDLPPSTAFSDRHAWTEILASWVCRQALEEGGYPYTQVQKERRVGRRTTFEPCFCVQQALTFAQVQGLVERTVELYRRGREKEAERRRGSFKGEKNGGGVGSGSLKASHSPVERDRDKTPLAVQHPQHAPPPPLERSSTYTYPPLPPRGNLERTASLPGKGLPSLQIPIPAPLPQQVPRDAHFPPGPPPIPTLQQHQQHPPQSPYHPLPPYSTSPGGYLFPRPAPLLPPRPPYIDPSDSLSTTSDSDSPYRSREREREQAQRRRKQHRSRSRRDSSGSYSKAGKKSSKVEKVASLATIGGLAAMLDGIVELGVLS